METFKVLIGTIESGSNFTQDNTREVVFEGENLGGRNVFTGTDRNGNITDFRGTKETLYRAEGKLIVHIENWSRWQGEPNIYSLKEITEDDLKPTGDYALLGQETGFGRPLTLDEALAL